MNETKPLLQQLHPWLGLAIIKTGVWIPQDEYGQRGLSIHMASSRAMHANASAIYTALQNTEKVRQWYKMSQFIIQK